MTVHLNVLFVRNTFFNEEFEDVASMIPLELDDRSPLIVLNGSTVAAPCLLEMTDNLLQVQIIGHTLNEGEALTRSSLLEMQV